MAIALTAQRIRFAIDASNPFGANPLNLLNNAPISIPSGSSVQFELQFYFQNLADATLLDLTQFSSIDISIQDNSDPHNATIYFTESVGSANFNTGATTAQWLAGTAQHITAPISSANNVIPPAATSYWIVVYGISTDANADKVLLYASNIQGKDSGIPTALNPLSAGFKAGTKLSFVCSDGLTRDLDITPGPNGIWVTAVNQAGYNGAGQAIFSLYCSDGLWRDLTLQSQAGQWVLALNQNGHS